MIDTQQSLHLERVRDRIAPHVLAFVREVARRPTPRFHLAELLAYVNARATIAPDSASRILRQLRRAGELDYEIVSRRDSLYAVLMVR